MSHRSLVAGVSLALSIATTATAGDGHQHAGDVIIGKTVAGQIIIEFDADEALPLVPVDGPLLFGCAHDDPGFESLEEDEPKEGIFVLPPGADIRLEIVSITPGLVIYSPGFAQTLDSAGEQMTLGPPPIHLHATFHFDSNHPQFDPLATPTLTFILIDDAGLCTDSEEITLAFQCAAPGACCLPDGECEEGEFEALCEEEGGAFLGEGSSCTPNACQQLGACCFADGFCEDVFQSECDKEGGVSAGPGTDCASSECHGGFQPIPTTSQWGLIVLALLLGIVAKASFGRRPATA